MQFYGARIREQGITFGIVVVEPFVLQNILRRDEMVHFGEQVFGTIPIVLMAQDAAGTPSYYGRPDIVRFLSVMPLASIPIREWTVPES